jgi:hypothetical protein
MRLQYLIDENVNPMYTMQFRRRPDLEELILIAESAFEDEYRDRIVNLPVP